VHHEVTDFDGNGYDEVESFDSGYHQEQGPSRNQQDVFGKAATTFVPSGKAGPVSGKLYKFFHGPLIDGIVLGLVAADGAETLSVDFADVPGLGAGEYSWTELYSGRLGRGSSVSVKLDAHDMAVYKISA